MINVFFFKKKTGLVLVSSRQIGWKSDEMRGQLTHWVIHFHAALHTDGAGHCVFYQLVHRLCGRQMHFDQQQWQKKRGAKHDRELQITTRYCSKFDVFLCVTEDLLVMKAFVFLFFLKMRLVYFGDVDIKEKNRSYLHSQGIQHFSFLPLTWTDVPLCKIIMSG